MALDTEDGELQSALDITLRRFAEFNNLQGAFARRALIEQAQGFSWRATTSMPTRPTSS